MGDNLIDDLQPHQIIDITLEYVRDRAKLYQTASPLHNMLDGLTADEVLAEIGKVVE